MAEKYEPELGQFTHGQPYKQYEVPEYITAVLQYIQHELWRVQHNNGDEEQSPFDNSGMSYIADTFEVEAYSWDETYNQPYNFKWKDLEISWYKYLGRGMSMNRETSPDEIVKMMNECLSSIRDTEKELF